ncbi:MAG: hypothetical protein Q7S36_02675 [Candidatus Liptonbacteria bacterium]|nr:hypothetical protein [Candidatus Liptonbacteria bacterium]
MLLLCEECRTIAHSAEVKVCKRCGVSSDKDKATLLYCPACADMLNLCRSCGKQGGAKAYKVSARIPLSEPISAESEASFSEQFPGCKVLGGANIVETVFEAESDEKAFEVARACGVVSVRFAEDGLWSLELWSGVKPANREFKPAKMILYLPDPISFT